MGTRAVTWWALLALAAACGRSDPTAAPTAAAPPTTADAADAAPTMPTGAASPEREPMRPARELVAVEDVRTPTPEPTPEPVVPAAEVEAGDEDPPAPGWTRLGLGDPSSGFHTVLDDEVFAAASDGAELVVLGGNRIDTATRDQQPAVWVSRDAGSTWAEASGPALFSGTRGGIVDRVLLLPNGRVLAFGAYRPPGQDDRQAAVWISDDRGATFAVHDGPATSFGESIPVFSVVALDGGLLAVDLDGGLHTSTDDGMSWTLVEQQGTGPQEVFGAVLLFSPGSSAVLGFPSVGEHDEEAVLRSDDGGTTWSARDDPALRDPEDTGFPRDVVATAEGALVVGGAVATSFRDVAVARSDDGGATWQRVEGVPGDGEDGDQTFEDLLVLPDGGILAVGSGDRDEYAGGAPGAWRSDDAGRTWVAVHPTTGNPDVSVDGRNPFAEEFVAAVSTAAGALVIGNLTRTSGNLPTGEHDPVVWRYAP